MDEKFNQEELSNIFNANIKRDGANRRELGDALREKRIDEMEPLIKADTENKIIENSDKEDLNNYRIGCDLCGNTGYVYLDGIKVTCTCRLKKEQMEKKKKQESDKIDIKIKDVDIMYKVIPKSRLSDEFSIDVSKEIITEMVNKQGCKVIGYDGYIGIISKLLAEIATTGVENSYIIGAPNTFGKTTFVYTAIKRLIAKGKKVVPYLSLTELTELKLKYNEALKNKDNYLELGKAEGFIWTDFINCDVLFTYLSTEEFKEIESKTLYSILKARGSKDKPTIVMTSQSMQWYTNDEKLNERYWSDMVSFRENNKFTGMDRMIPVYCYKKGIAMRQLGIGG